MSAVAADELDEIVRSDQPQSIRFIACPLQCSGAERAGEIKNRSGGSGRWNPTLVGELLVREIPRAMDPYTASLPTAGTGSESHVDGTRCSLRTDRPQRRGGVMAQYCAVPAGKNRGDPPPLHCQLSVPDGVDTSMNAKQPPSRHLSCHPVLAEAECIELRGREHPVLALSQLRNHFRGVRGAFLGHTTSKAPRALFTPRT